MGKREHSALGALQAHGEIRAVTAVVSMSPKLSKKTPVQDKPLQPVLGTTSGDSSSPVWATGL